MTELIRRFPDVVSSAQGLFSPSVMARRRADGSWEAWLEFARTGPDAVAAYATDIETHQHDRVAMERWASGLTRVYAEGALTRAHALHPETPASDLLDALHEIVEALDRRLPQMEQARERDIAADAKRLRAGALQRIATLRRQLSAASG